MNSETKKTNFSTVSNSPFKGMGGWSVSFIGAGKVGTSLGIYFKDNGLNIGGYFSRSMQSAEQASTLTHSTAYAGLENLVNDSQIIWITTPDDSIKTVAEQISELNIANKKTFIHASGSITSDTLNCLKEKGHRVCSAHPLLAFSDITKAVSALKDTAFFIEGQTNNLAEIKKILAKTGNNYHIIDKKNKPAYHAAAAILSNYLVTLVHASNQLFDLVGIDEKTLGDASLILVKSVLDNLQGKTPAEALTGPIKRGDAETVKKHLEVLEQNLPELTEFYKLMGRETMRMINNFQLNNILQ